MRINFYEEEGHSLFSLGWNERLVALFCTHSSFSFHLYVDFFLFILQSYYLLYFSSLLSVLYSSEFQVRAWLLFCRWICCWRESIRLTAKLCI
jgi:hypothetical protein